MHNDCTNIALKQLVREGEGSIIRVKPSTPALEEPWSHWRHHDVFLRTDGTVFDPMRPKFDGLSFDEWVKSWEYHKEYDFSYLNPDKSRLFRKFK